MKKVAFVSLGLSLCIAGYGQSNPVYNQRLADSLGADKYGMKQYYLVLLSSGDNSDTAKQKRDAAFGAHMDNIERLAAEGKLIVAGPVGKNAQELRGIFILSAATKEEAYKLLDSDRAVSEHYLQAEIYEWYGSAALPLYLNSHKTIEKERH